MKIGSIYVGCFIALLICISSCHKDDMQTGEVVIPQETNLMSLKDYGYYETFQINSNTNWEIVCEGDWFYTLPHQGKGTTAVKLCVIDNPLGSKKTGKMVIKFSNGEEKTHSLSQNGKDEENAFGDMPAVGYKQFAVGHGYNYFDRAAHPSSVKTQIFDITSLIESNYLLQNPASSSVESETLTGSSTKEITEKLSVKAGLSSEFCGFVGEAKASFDATVSSNANSEFAIYSGKAIKTEWYINNSMDELIDNYLTPGAKKAINGTASGVYSGTQGIPKLVNDFGTHVIMRAYLGGKYSVKLTIDRSKISQDYDVAAYAKAAYKNKFVDANVEVDAKYNNSYKANQEACRVKLDILGGSSATKSQKAICDKGGIDNWENSLSESDYKNCALMAFDDNALIPIWELCKDENGNTGLDTERGKAIKAYVEGGYYASVEIKSSNSEVIQIPNFESITEKSSLIKRVELSSGGTIVAEVCNEYIPALSQNSRVTVIYPVVGGKPRYDAGLFIGNSEHHPSRIQWNGSSLSVIAIDTLPRAPLRTIYKQGMSFSTKTYTDPNSTICKDQFHVDNHFTSTGYSYPLVKIGDNVWLREDYGSTVPHRGVLLRDDNTMLKNHGVYTIYDKSVFYNKAAISLIAPANWEVPSNIAVNNLILYVNSDHKAILRDGMSGANFHPNGVVNDNFQYASNDEHWMWASSAKALIVTENRIEFSELAPHFGCQIRLVRKPDFRYY